MSDATVYGPDPLDFDGLRGHRYWVRNPYPLTGDAEADERLGGFPVAVFAPPARPRRETPVVVALQGMAAPSVRRASVAPMA